MATSIPVMFYPPSQKVAKDLETGYFEHKLMAELIPIVLGKKRKHDPAALIFKTKTLFQQIDQMYV